MSVCAATCERNCTLAGVHAAPFPALVMQHSLSLSACRGARGTAACRSLGRLLDRKFGSSLPVATLRGISAIFASVSCGITEAPPGVEPATTDYEHQNIALDEDDGYAILTR